MLVLKAIKELIKEKSENGKYLDKKKVVLKVSSEEELMELYYLIKQSDLPCSLITDAGHTQIEPSTKTCLCVGPGPDEEIDKLTGHLKLL